MPEQESKCPLCERAAEVRRFSNMDAFEVTCGWCGRFGIERLLRRVFESEKDQQERDRFAYLAPYIRQANQRGEEVMLSTDNWESFARLQMGTPISRKMSKLLELMASRAKPGFGLQLNPEVDPPLVDATSTKELAFMLADLTEQEYFKKGGGGWSYMLKPKAWDRLQSASIGTGIPGKCFVAMSFHKDLTDAYDKAILLAIKEDCNMQPVRADRIEHNEDINDKIVAEIRTCQFLVADVTRQSHGVYFEAGFAMALNRPVIWTCRRDDFANVHFDARQFSHIVWDTVTDLREKLATRIRATIPGAV